MKQKRLENKQNAINVGNEFTKHLALKCLRCLRYKEGKLQEKQIKYFKR